MPVDRIFMNLDIRTLIAVAGITHVVLLTVFSYQYFINKSYRGIGWWVLWSAAEAVGFAFMLLREIPAINTFAIILQNMMIVLGMIFLYIGIMRFFDKKEDKRIVVSIFGVFLIFFLYFIFVKNDIQIRGIIITTTLTILSFLSAHALLIHRPKSLSISANITAALFLAHGCFFAFRTVMGFKEGVNLGVLVQIPLNVTMYVCVMASSVLWIFSLIVMINQRSNSEMKETKEEMEVIFNTSPDATVISRVSDGMIVYVNEGFTSISGFARNEVIRRSVLDADIWENPEGRQRIINEIHKKGFVDNFESRFVKKDGSRLYGLTSAKIINLQGFPHLISITRDITKLKHTEEELQMSKDRAHLQRIAIAKLAVDEAIVYGDIPTAMRRIVEEVSSAIQVERTSVWLLSEDNKILRCIALFEAKEKRHSEGEILQSADYPRYFKAIRSENRICVSDARNDLRTSEFTTGYLIPLGIASMLDSGIQMKGNLAGVVCFEHIGYRRTWRSDEEAFSSTIAALVAQTFANAERKHAEKALKDGEQKFRTLFEDSRDAIYITTKDGRFIDFNHAYLELFGYSREEMKDLLVKDTYMNPAERDTFRKKIEGKGSVRDYEVKLRKKNGQEMDCLITAVTRYDDSEISGYQGIIRDITEKKQMEEKLRTLSIVDDLTGLYNRRGFFTLTQQQIKVADRTKKSMLLFFIDLDKMKQINDVLGHQEGDKAIVEVAKILKEVFRESDIIGRIGGDEFAILAIDTTDETKDVLMKRLDDYLDDCNREEGRNYQLSLSIGISRYNPEKPSTLDKLMAQADMLMYDEKKKKNGTNIIICK